jgi:N-ethylmaleimide reductase
MAGKLFEPWRVGEIELTNRVAMAPMTRNRAGRDGVPTEAMARYYAQRAGAGLIITEGTQPSSTGKGYPGTPGIHDHAQQSGWANVAAAVHDAGGRIVCQLMHTGRMSHPLTQPNGRLPVAPSAVRPAGQIDTDSCGPQPLVDPRALDLSELGGIASDFADAAERAVAAGLDGIELHAANGYLLHQFLATNTNLRTDAYGGSPAGRSRFVVEVAKAVAQRIGAGRVGIRISPGGRFNDIVEDDPVQIYSDLIPRLASLDLAYLHTVRRRSFSLDDVVRGNWAGTVIVNSGFGHNSELEYAEPLVRDGIADMVSVGRLFISNPDLLERWRRGLPRAQWDESTFYTPGEQGLTDYPTAAQPATLRGLQP